MSAAPCCNRHRPRGASIVAEELRAFELRADAVIVTSGGIGGNPALVRRTGRSGWARCPPWLAGVPGARRRRMIGITEAAGARVINQDRMWHYTEGITNYDPVWPNPRHPDPARPVVAVAGRHRKTAARPAVSRVRHLGTLEAHHPVGSTHLVHPSTPGSSRRNSACRSGTEPGSHRTQCAPAVFAGFGRVRRAGTGIRGPRVDFARLAAARSGPG